MQVPGKYGGQELYSPLQGKTPQQHHEFWSSCYRCATVTSPRRAAKSKNHNNEDETSTELSRCNIRTEYDFLQVCEVCS